MPKFVGPIGSGPFGDSPYGSIPTIEGPYLSVTDPADGDHSVAPNAPIVIEIASTAGIDIETFYVTFNGDPVVTAGVFESGYAGTLLQEDYAVSMVLSTHPDLPDGRIVVVETSVTDRSGRAGDFGWSFYVDAAYVTLSEVVGSSESTGLYDEYQLPLSEHPNITEVLEIAENDIYIGEIANVTENWYAHVEYSISSYESLNLNERCRVRSWAAYNLDPWHIQVEFPYDVLLDDLTDTRHFKIERWYSHGVPIAIEDVEPSVDILLSGLTGTYQGNKVFRIDAGLDSSYVGTYLKTSEDWLRIASIVGSGSGWTDIELEKPIKSRSSLSCQVTSAAWGAVLTTNKISNAEWYVAYMRNLIVSSTGERISGKAVFQAISSKPKVVGAEASEDNITVFYDSDMRLDSILVDPHEYQVVGPSTVFIEGVLPGPDPKSVTLLTAGLRRGTYEVIVNAASPKDEAGNPIDPDFNDAVFDALTPTSSRSIFTDRGPIAKPPLTLWSGSTATIWSHTEVRLVGTSLPVNCVGKYLKLTGTSNAGDYTILARPALDRVRVAASFDMSVGGTPSWEIYDPRTGQIADDPSDVVVRVNGIAVGPTAVVGLLGQVVLPDIPVETDDVKIDYSWICNPTVEYRRLNSREFVLNAWNHPFSATGKAHSYAYNTVMVTPSSYETENLLAPSRNPTERRVHYRAYERAYTAALNDPNLLLLNVPTHRVAYVPMSRILSPVSVRYDGQRLPENDAAAPWIRTGAGPASLTIDGYLQLGLSTEPVFWTRTGDMSFSHTFTQTIRMRLDAAASADTVFTGVVFGSSDEEKAFILGFLTVGGVRKIGFMRHEGGDLTVESSWIGGINPLTGFETGLPAILDWSEAHSYRLIRDRDGHALVFTDDSTLPILRVDRAEMPFLEEIDIPMFGLQTIFFGAIQRPVASVSFWEQVRYQILPTSPYESAPTSFVNYEGGVIPEDALAVWTPVGAHGVETIQVEDLLLLDSTSAVSPEYEAVVGLTSGDFRGFLRMEPLLATSSSVSLHVRIRLLSHTHGFSKDASTFAIDDGDRLMQVCFLSSIAEPKISYGGRKLPTEIPYRTWEAASSGSATAKIVDQMLHISDTDTDGGLVYFSEDVVPIDSPDRTVSSLYDYALEFRCLVESYVPESAIDPKFAGVMAQVYDGVRLVGLMFCEILGQPVLAFHSDGVFINSCNFAWNDGSFHTYRLVKNTSGDLVSLFVDATFIGSLPYSDFYTTIDSNPIGMVSFGSATAVCIRSISTVNWCYVNAWRVDPSERRFVGLWNGGDPTTLQGYHLPLTVSGRGRVVGNVLEDTIASFVSSGVVAGQLVSIDTGNNRGTYEIANVVSQTVLTFYTAFPDSPSDVAYRVVQETDWTIFREYKLLRTSTGVVSLSIDDEEAIRTDYGSLSLPLGAAGVFRGLSIGIPSVAFGAFDPQNLSQSTWDFVRYGITRQVDELRIVPLLETVNQYNVIASAEHLRTSIAHSHTCYKSCSVGIPPNTVPDLFDNPNLTAYTTLNDGTPIVPLTQTFENRRPFPIEIPNSGLNRIEDTLNRDADFVLNDVSTRVEIVVPDDVLYNCLQIKENASGEDDLLSPVCDLCGPDYNVYEAPGRHCLVYDASTIPENDPNAMPPWIRVDDDPSQVVVSVYNNVLTYETGLLGTRTVYENATRLPDNGWQTQSTFVIKVLKDSTGGVGDTQIRFGLMAPGLSVGVAFLTTSIGERFVALVDLIRFTILGTIPFDYLDGEFHTYKLLKDIGTRTMQLSIEV